MKKHKFHIITVVFLVAAYFLPAQKPLSFAGPQGIFTQFGTSLPDTFAYRLFRAENGNSQKPLLVFTGNRAESPEELKVRLLNINAKNPVYKLPDDSVVNLLFDLLNRYLNIDSFPVYFKIPPFIEAMGLGYYDKAVEPGKEYIYTVSKADKKGRILASVAVSPVTIPGSIPDFGTKLRKSVPSNKEITIDFTFNSNNPPFDVRVYRQAYLQTRFREINPEEFFYTENDSSFYRFTDKQVIPGTIYRYLVVPYDILGNTSPCRDTVMVTCKQDQTDFPVFSKLTTESLSEKKAIKLNWEHTGGSLIYSISVFRSELYDGDYQLLIRLPGEETSYIDPNIIPLHSYHYYLILHGLNTEFPPSGKVTGMLGETPAIPLSPHNLTLKQTTGRNLLTWDQPEPGIKGYYAYRAIGFGSEFIQISGLIPTEGHQAHFLDSAQNLLPGITYSYTVAALGSGLTISPKSEPVFSEPIAPSIPAPTNFYINRQGNNAFLVWDAMIERSPFISGYQIFRASPEKGSAINPLPLTELPLPYDQNTFLDTTLKRGVHYEYTVKAVGTGNSVSPPSLSFSFILPELKPFPPTGIRLTKTEKGGILYWDEPATENILSFIVYREKSPDGSPEKITELPPGSNTLEIASPEKGMSFYTVSVMDTTGRESARSEEVWLFVP